MNAYPDTSFLCGLYVQQSSSAKAIRHYSAMSESLHVTALLLFEFRQSVRFNAFRHSNDKTQGYSKRTAAEALAKLQENIDCGAVIVVPANWSEVIARAERLSAQFTKEEGHRPFDIFHVATALELGVKEFLTFDEKQGVLAKAVGLKVKP